MSSRASGTTLIEVVIALAVLIVGLAAAAGTVVYSSRSASTGLHVEQGTAVAQSLLTALLAVPYNSSGTGASAAPNTIFTNVTTANDADVMDSAKNFRLATLPINAFDHTDAELPANVAALVAPSPPNGIAYERYWNIAPLGPKAVVIAVIVRWKEGPTVYDRTVVVGTRYQP